MQFFEDEVLFVSCCPAQLGIKRWADSIVLGAGHRGIYNGQNV